MPEELTRRRVGVLQWAIRKRDVGEIRETSTPLRPGRSTTRHGKAALEGWKAPDSKKSGFKVRPNTFLIKASRSLTSPFFELGKTTSFRCSNSVQLLRVEVVIPCRSCSGLMQRLSSRPSSDPCQFPRHPEVRERDQKSVPIGKIIATAERKRVLYSTLPDTLCHVRYPFSSSTWAKKVSYFPISLEPSKKSPTGRKSIGNLNATASEIA